MFDIYLHYLLARERTNNITKSSSMLKMCWPWLKKIQQMTTTLSPRGLNPLHPSYIYIL